MNDTLRQIASCIRPICIRISTSEGYGARRHTDIYKNFEYSSVYASEFDEGKESRFFEMGVADDGDEQSM